jgi:hypothetical protein
MRSTGGIVLLMWLCCRPVGAALAQADAPVCKGLDREACQATPGCVFYVSAREAQAYATEKRAHLTDAERRAGPPWLDYPVPENQIRWGNGDVGCQRKP